MKLKDQIAIVTGAGTGIGRGIALALANEGAKIAIATLLEEEGEETRALIEAQGGSAQAFQTDVASEASIRGMVERVVTTYGKVDTLVNNAGITIFKSLFEATSDDWERLININLRGTFLCSKYVAEVMKTRGGSIINISSNHALATIPNAEIYAASKGGINAMTRALALSLGPYKIRVNAIMPGFTATPHYERWLASHGERQVIEDEIMSLHASGKIAYPEEIGKLAVFLASSDSSSMTGAELLMDNALSVRLYNSKLV
ncbi:MAG: SDR family oxidoreductase [Trueperaceae bacterium]|nr:SDR family oxidoreductase [Trueperaceae bacterium]